MIARQTRGLIFLLEHTNCGIIFFALEKTNKKCTFYFILFFFFVLILFCVSRETTKQNKICQKKIRDKFFFSIQHMFQSILSKKNQVHNFYKQKYEFEHHGQMLTFNIFKLTTFLTITILNSYHSYVKHFQMLLIISHFFIRGCKSLSSKITIFQFNLLNPRDTMQLSEQLLAATVGGNLLNVDKVYKVFRLPQNINDLISLFLTSFLFLSWCKQF